MVANRTSIPMRRKEPKNWKTKIYVIKKCILQFNVVVNDIHLQYTQNNLARSYSN